MSSQRGSDDVARCLIVDDEPLAREGIRLRLEAEDGFQVVGECQTVDQAVARVHEDPPDVLFLDIQMPGRDGFDLLRETGLDTVPVVVFVTAYSEHALEAFRVRALDYLVKPVDEDRFADALARIRRRLAEVRDGELGQRVRRAVTAQSSVSPARNASLERIAVRADDRVSFVAVDDIDWIEAARDYVVLHVGERKHLIRTTMAGILEDLGVRFARIHRSTIVNVGRIRELRSAFHGGYVVVLEDGTRLRLSRSYRAELAAVLGTKL